MSFYKNDLFLTSQEEVSIVCVCVCVCVHACVCMLIDNFLEPLNYNFL